MAFVIGITTRNINIGQIIQINRNLLNNQFDILTDVFEAVLLNIFLAKLADTVSVLYIHTSV
jgi:hypothetical protein